MNEHPKIELQSALCVSEGRFEYLGEDTLVSRVGAALLFLRLTAPSGAGGNGNAGAERSQSLLQFPAGYAVDAWTVSNTTPGAGQGVAQVVVALSGVDTRIHVYSWPRLHLVQCIVADEVVAFNQLALSRDGRHLLATTAEGKMQLRYWDLQAPPLELQLGFEGQGLTAEEVREHQTNRLLRAKEVALPLSEPATLLSFNPFNHTQCVVGSERAVQVVTISASTSFQLATLTPQPVQIDYNNLSHRRIKGAMWMSDRQLLLHAQTGEILAVNMKTPAAILAMRERELQAQQQQQQAQTGGNTAGAAGGADTPGADRSASGGGAVTPGGAAPAAPAAATTTMAPTGEIEVGLTHLPSSELALLTLVDPSQPPHARLDWKNEEGRNWASQSILTCTLWGNGQPLPLAPARDQDEEGEEEDEAHEHDQGDKHHEEKLQDDEVKNRGHGVSAAGGTSSSATAAVAAGLAGVGAIPTCLALTRHEVVVGTHDGCLLWIDRRNPASITHHQIVDPSATAAAAAAAAAAASGSPSAALSDAGVAHIAFSPSFATFVAWTRRGHLRLYKPLGDRAGGVHVQTAPGLDGATTTALEPFQTTSLGYFQLVSSLGLGLGAGATVAAATEVPAPSSAEAASLVCMPRAMLTSRRPVRVGHVLVPTQPGDIASRHFKLLSYSSTGVVALWSYGARRALLGSYHMRAPISAAAVSLDGSLAVLGLESGVINILDLSRPSYLRLVCSTRLHAGPVLGVAFNREGDMFASLGHAKVFFLRTSDFRVVGYAKAKDLLEEAQSPSAAKDASVAGAGADPTEEKDSLALASSSSKDTAAASAAAALALLQAEKEKNDDEDEVPLGLVQQAATAPAKAALEHGATANASSNDASVKETPVPDTFQALVWASAPSGLGGSGDGAPAAERLVLSTRLGLVVVVSAPNTYHDAPEMKLDLTFLAPAYTRLQPVAPAFDGAPAREAGSITHMQVSVSDRALLLATNSNKLLQVYSLSSDGGLALAQSWNDDIPRGPDGAPAPDADVEEIGPDLLLHQRPPTVLAQAAQGNLVVSTGGDGLVLLRDGETLSYLTRFPVHDFALGGSVAVSLAPDASALISSGYDGALLVFDLSPLAGELARRTRGPKPRPPPPRNARLLESLGEVEESAGASEPCYIAALRSSRAGGALGAAAKEKDLHARVLKDDLQRALAGFKTAFLALQARNARLPPLEQLSVEETAIDLELSAFLKAEGEARVEAVREQIRLECVGKEYVIARIKQACWNSMEVQGEAFTGFRTAQDGGAVATGGVGSVGAGTAAGQAGAAGAAGQAGQGQLLEVHNFPIRLLSPGEQRRLRQVQFLRRMEIVEKRWRFNQSLKSDEAAESQDRSFAPSRFTEDSGAYIVNLEKEEAIEIPGLAGGVGGATKDGKDASTGGKDDGKKADAKGGKDGAGDKKSKSSSSTGGSGAGGSGGGGHGKNAQSVSLASSELSLDNLGRFLLFHPLDVVTPLRKRTQALLLAHKIVALKRAFNDAFQEFYAWKQREIEHIHEKAKRIAEIQSELGMDAPVWRPVLAPSEIAASVLQVDDSEIRAPKVLSKAERAIADAKAERERLHSESADDGPERALQVMMNGTLVPKRDLSLLEQELIPEPWMLSIPPEEFTEEQKAEVARFEKKVKLIQAEQETRRKLLQTELGKLKSDVADIARTFDARLRTQLSDARIAVSRDIFQHELAIIKLLNDLLAEEDKQREEQEINHKLAMLARAQTIAEDMTRAFEQATRQAQVQYETALAELKAADRAFKRDLAQGGVSAEQSAAAMAEYQAALDEYQALVAEQNAQVAAGQGGDLVDEANNPLPLPPAPVPPPPVQVGAGESLEGLYKLFRQKKAAKPGAGGKKRGTGGAGGLGSTLTAGLTGGRHLRAGSVIGGRLGLLGTLPGEDLRGRLASRDGTTPATAATGVPRKRRKDGEDDAGDGSMNPYPSDLLAHLSALTASHPSSVAAGPPVSLLEDVRYLDLDARDKPDALDADLWDALLQRRAAWIDSERALRQQSYRMHEMALHLQHLHDASRAMASERRALQAYRGNLFEARLLFSLNSEVLLHLSQGAVELASAPVVSDLSECFMLDRRSVEALNTVIQRAGAEKVAILRDTTVSRTAINLLDWTRAKLALEHADSVDLTTELQLLRVTKSLQGIIKMGGHDQQKAAELKQLDRKMEFVAAASRDQLLGKKLRLLQLRKKIKQQSRENERLYETVAELESAVKERMQISSIRDEGRLEDSRAGAERMKALVTRRKLVDLAKLQSEEVRFLRQQVEELRRRTFASFAIPNSQQGNPDERAQHGRSFAHGRAGYSAAAAAAPMARSQALPSAASPTKGFDPSRTLPHIGSGGGSAAASHRSAGVPQLPPVQRAGSAGFSSR